MNPLSTGPVTNLFKLKNNQHKIALGLVLVLAAALRFLFITNLTHFKGDQGKDAFWAQDIATGREFRLSGPPTSIGNIDLGPAYYYLLAPFSTLFNHQPRATPIAVALFGLLSVGLLYCFLRLFLAPGPAVLGSFLYAVSAEIVFFQRFAWNPNPMPFFVLLFWLGLVFFDRGRLWGLLLAGLGFGVASQLHFTGFFLALAGLLFLLLTRYRPKLSDWSAWAGAGGVVLLVNLPFIFYQRRNGLPLVRGAAGLIKALLGWEDFGGLAGLGEKIPLTQQMAQNILSWGGFWSRSLSGYELPLAGVLVSLGLLVVFVRQRKQVGGLSTIVWAWLFSGLPVYLLFSGKLFPHYFTYFFPVPFILLAVLVGSALNADKRVKTGLVLALIVLVLINLGSTIGDLMGYQRGEFNPKYGPTLSEMAQVAVVVKDFLDQDQRPGAFFATNGEKRIDDGGYRYVLWSVGGLTQEGERDILPPNRVAKTNFVVVEPRGALALYGLEAIVERSLRQPQANWRIVEQKQINNLELLKVVLKEPN